MSVTRTDVQQQLGRILAEESQLLSELQQVLERETNILCGEDPEAIARIGSNRHRCVDRLSQLGVERLDACRMLSYGNDRTGLSKLHDWADPSGRLRNSWTSNLQLAGRCKALNDKNGAIVAAKLGRVKKLLGHLRGSNPPPVYSAKASRYGNLGPRDLGRA